MKILAQLLTIGSGANRFTYKQILRKGNYAVYEQQQFGRTVAFEAIRIQSHSGYDVAGTWIAPAESMPSASAWGIHGFTLPDKLSAIRKMVEMMTPRI